MVVNTLERNSRQATMPASIKRISPPGGPYNLYPYHSLGEGEILTGYPSLAEWLSKHRLVRIDGYVGVDWGNIIAQLSAIFDARALKIKWIQTASCFKSQEEIDSLVQPFLGEEESVWGRITTLELSDFFVQERLGKFQADSQFDLTIIIGVGAGLVAKVGPLLYFDLPKNELLYRMRAGAITNLGSNSATDTSSMYKRFYFVDWIMLNKHKDAMLRQTAIMADSQWNDTVNWVFADDLFSGLKRLSTSVFRPRPWFDPGVWGGQWMKEHFPSLSRDEPNFAWSFEIIAPENGLVFESDGHLLEVSFDTLMFMESESILGRHHRHFGTYFPIRFDFLDTYQGGNLSIQCHPSPSYIQEHFGEKFTQDETYYMLDCEADSLVYLGFNDDIDPAEFRGELEESLRDEREVDVEKYVQTFRPKKHDLFLIPNRTVHSSGRNNMVLEISATPYIYTFKMYDWLQRDSAGNPRPINIDHAFNNLDFGRKGARVSEELMSEPKVIDAGADWTLVHLPTHADHYYDVHRIEFENTVRIETDNACHILMLVEGERLSVETAGGNIAEFNYAETFIVPAAARHYSLVNKGTGTAKVVKAFVKYGFEVLNGPV